MSLSKSSSVSVLVARLLLGLIFFVFGLNFFLHFIPNNTQPEGKAAAFLGGLFQTGYLFPLIKVIEVLAGAFLLAGFFVPLVLVILMPITVNIILFHSFLEPGIMPITISYLILLSQIWLAWNYRDYYKQLFILRPAL
jgi:putative oxidoreductase